MTTTLDDYIDDNVRVLRINGVKELTSESIIDYFKEEGMILVVLGIERIPHLHYHLVVKHSDNEYWGKQNNKLKRKIKKQFGVEKSDFSTSSVRTTVRKTILYSIKDCELGYYGIDEKIIQRYKAQSTKKFKRKEFKEEMDKIENSWYDDEIDEATFIDKYIDLKVNYGQNPNPTGEERYLVKHIIKKDKNLRKEYKDQRKLGIDRLLGRYENPY